MISLKELSDIRRSYAGAKYLMPNGENQADYRNSLLDIAEELSDALHIGELTKSKVMKYNIALTPDATKLLDEMNAHLYDAYATVLELKELLPEFYSTDRIVVDRPIRLE